MPFLCNALATRTSVMQNGPDSNPGYDEGYIYIYISLISSNETECGVSQLLIYCLIDGKVDLLTSHKHVVKAKQSLLQHALRPFFVPAPQIYIVPQNIIDLSIQRWVTGAFTKFELNHRLMSSEVTDSTFC